jgi:hypothetical protein
MISVFIAVLPVLFMWEFAAIKVNYRLPKPLRKRLFRIGSRFAILAIIIELLGKLVPLGGPTPLPHAFAAALFTTALPEELIKFAGAYRVSRRELDAIGPGIAILLAVGASLGFAVLENKLYVLGGRFALWVGASAIGGADACRGWAGDGLIHGDRLARLPADRLRGAESGGCGAGDLPFRLRFSAVPAQFEPAPALADRNFSRDHAVRRDLCDAGHGLRPEWRHRDL